MLLSSLYAQHQHDTTQITLFDENVRDVSAAMLTSASHTGVTLVYDDELDTLAISVDTVSSTNVEASLLGTPTYTTLQHIHDIFHSAGAVTGGIVTDAGAGLINVAAGTGFIRAVNDSTSTLFIIDWSSASGLSLTDQDNNYIIVDYNAGTPAIIVSATEPNEQSQFLLAKVYRDGTAFHISNGVAKRVGDHAGLMITRLQNTQPFARESGAIISEIGTRNISITSGVFWEGLNTFSTPAFDSSVAGTFTYYYRDGVGGWTGVPDQTQINNTQYDDSDGILGTVAPNKYGVHWVYLEPDGEIAVIYGRDSYNLDDVQAALPPADNPPHLLDHGRVISKIIIERDSATFTSTESVFTTEFASFTPTDHGLLIGLDNDDHPQYHNDTRGDIRYYTQTLADSTFRPLASPVPASDVEFTLLGSPTYTTLQEIHNVFHSSGIISGGIVTDAGAGLINVAAGTGFIRATADATSTLYPSDWSSESGLALTDQATNFVYVDYNAGTPIVVVSLVEPNRQSQVLLATVFQIGTELHLSNMVSQTILDHAGAISHRFRATMPYTRESGAITTEIVPRYLAISEGVFWEGLNRFITAAFDSSVADTFNSHYSDGTGGWSHLSAQTQIDNTQYDDGDGTLGLLSNNQYGVHWIFLDPDGTVSSIFGEGSYTLTEANAVLPSATLIDVLAHQGKIIAKIIIEKDDTSFTSIVTMYGSDFAEFIPTDHSDLSGLNNDDHLQYHNDTRGDIRYYTQTLANTTFIANGDFTANGIMARTGASTYASRTITGTANEIEVTDGDGAAGNPTVGLPNDVTIGNDLTVTGSTSTTAIQFPLTAPAAHSEGLITYDNVNKSFIGYIDNSEVALNIGEEQWLRVFNLSGDTINNGEVVYISGSSGTLPYIIPAQADTRATSETIGVATHTIENNTAGVITTFGLVRGLNTNTFTEGDIVYLSETLSGIFTITEPSGDTDYPVRVGIIIKSDLTNGILMVNPSSPLDSGDINTNNFAMVGAPTAPTAVTTTNTTQLASTAFVQQELGAFSTTLEGLDDTTITTPADGEALLYDFGISKWINGIISTTFAGLTDTTITAVADGEVLTYDNATGKWINETLAEAGIAPVASPALTGIPTAPTAAPTTNTTQIASTAFVQTEIGTATQATLTEYKYTATSGQTTFTGADDNTNVLSYTAGRIIVSLNGAVLPSDDYTATNGTSIVFGVGIPLNDEVVIQAFGTANIAPPSAKYVYEEFVATASQTTFTITGGYTAGQVTVTRNGSQLAAADITITSGTDVVLATGATVGDVITVQGYKDGLYFKGNTLTQYQYTATAGQTTFTGVDDNTLTLSYVQGGLLVVRNGIVLEDTEDYAATDGTSVVLTAGATLDDDVNILVFGTFNVADTYTQAQIDAMIGSGVSLDVSNNWTKAQYHGTATLTDEANISWDAADSPIAEITLTDNRTLANPTNMVDGMQLILRINQDAIGSRTLAYGTAYNFEYGTVPILTTTANARDVLYCLSDGTNLDCQMAKDSS